MWGRRMAEEGIIPPDIDTIDGLWAAAHIAAPFPSWSMTQSHFRDQGVLLSPVAGPPGTKADVIQVCAPFGGKIVNFTAVRIGMPPIVPDSAPSIDNYVLSKEFVNTHAPLLSEDGQTQLHVVTGTYIYLALLPLTPQDGFPMGTTPYTTVPASINILGPQFFSKTLLGGDPQPVNIKNQPFNIKG